MTIDLKRDGPIGVFDSGVGGLSVLHHIRRLLPAEPLCYVADTGYLPYGNKPAAVVRQRSLAIGRFLIEQGAKAIVVACNTATAAAVAQLREAFALPVVGVEPGVKPAINLSRSGVVGVLATEGTLGSEKFQRLVSQHGQQCRVMVRPCPGWVERVESGDLDSDQTRALVAAIVGPLREQGADTLVLGCTHYPYLRPLIEQLAGPGVAIVDTGQAIARELRRRLAQHDLLLESQAGGGEQLWVSGDVALAAPQFDRLWHPHCPIQALPERFR